MCRLSLVVESEGYSSVVMHGHLIAVASFVMEHRLLAPGLRQLQLEDSGGRLSNFGTLISFSMTCGIFEDQRINPCLLHWQANSYCCTSNGVLNLYFLKKCVRMFSQTFARNIYYYKKNLWDGIFWFYAHFSDCCDGEYFLYAF